VYVLICFVCYPCGVTINDDDDDIILPVPCHLPPPKAIACTSDLALQLTMRALQVQVRNSTELNSLLTKQNFFISNFHQSLH